MDYYFKFHTLMVIINYSYLYITLIEIHQEFQLKQM